MWVGCFPAGLILEIDLDSFPVPGWDQNCNEHMDLSSACSCWILDHWQDYTPLFLGCAFKNDMLTRGIALCWCSESEWFQICLFNQLLWVGGLMSRVEHCLYIGSVGFFGTILITCQTTGTLLNTRTFCGLATGTGTVFCFLLLPGSNWYSCFEPKTLATTIHYRKNHQQSTVNPLITFIRDGGHAWTTSNFFIQA